MNLEPWTLSKIEYLFQKFNMLLLIQKETGTDIDLQGGRKEVKKSNHLVWHTNKVKLLFCAYQLRGNIHPLLK